MLRKCFILSGNVQTSHSANFRIAQRSHHGSQIIWLDTNITVVDHEDFVASFLHHPDQFRDFIVDGGASRAIEDSNLTFGEIAHQLLKSGHGSVVLIANAENQLIIRVVLPAITSKVFVGFWVQAAYGLQVTHWRGKIQISRGTVFRLPEKKPGTIQDKQVVDERRGS